jgi:hypothetical protein
MGRARGLVVAGLFGAGLLGGAAGLVGSARPYAAGMGEGPVPDRMERPSHHERYRVAVLSTAMGRRGAATWAVRVAAADGRPVEGAAVAVRGGMPWADRVMATQPRAHELGGGRYRLAGLRFDAPGWWTIALVVTSPEFGTDSLAFNLILPGREPGEAGP